MDLTIKMKSLNIMKIRFKKICYNFPETRFEVMCAKNSHYE